MSNGGNKSMNKGIISNSNKSKVLMSKQVHRYYITLPHWRQYFSDYSLLVKKNTLNDNLNFDNNVLTKVT